MEKRNLPDHWKYIVKMDRKEINTKEKIMEKETKEKERKVHLVCMFAHLGVCSNNFACGHVRLGLCFMMVAPS